MKQNKATLIAATALKLNIPPSKLLLLLTKRTQLPPLLSCDPSNPQELVADAAAPRPSLCLHHRQHPTVEPDPQSWFISDEIQLPCAVAPMHQFDHIHHGYRNGAVTRRAGGAEGAAGSGSGLGVSQALSCQL